MRNFIKTQSIRAENGINRNSTQCNESYGSLKVFCTRKSVTTREITHIAVLKIALPLTIYPDVIRECCAYGTVQIVSRTLAWKSLDLEEERKALTDIGILHAIRRKSDLDEAPSSYKDIDQVMALQEDLVDVEILLKPLAVIKG